MSPESRIHVASHTMICISRTEKKDMLVQFVTTFDENDDDSEDDLTWLRENKWGKNKNRPL